MRIPFSPRRSEPTLPSPPTPSRELTERVKTFWTRAPCGSKHALAPEGTAAFYRQVETRRSELEPFIGDYARWDDAAGSDVLEIGVGLGTDFIKFARAGARVTGVDLTERSVELVRRRLALEGLPGTVLAADATSLPFEAASFDVVYSWGVLHHTTDPERGIREALRVLRPTGRFCMMLYARRSWVALALWVRHALLTGRPLTSLPAVVAAHMESPGTRAFTIKELRQAFDGATDLRIDKVLTPYDRRVAGPLARLAGCRLGWFIVVRGRAPHAPGARPT